MILRQLGAAIVRINQSWRSQPARLPKFSSFEINSNGDFIYCQAIG